MKTRNAALLAVLASASLSALPAAAQVGWYVGAGGGQGDLDGAQKKETVWTVRGGYMFTPFLGLEAAYYDLGKYRFQDSSLGVTIGGTEEVQAYGGALVGVIPFAQAFEGYGRVGYAHNKGDFKLDLDNNRFKGRETQNGAYWGAGLRYKFNPNAGIFAEYTKHEKIDIQQWMLGVDFHF